MLVILNLTGRVYTRLSQNFLAGGSALQDTAGHGTNTAGVIVGRTTGVAPNARLVSLRVADNAGYWPGATATAIQTITNAGNLNANDRIQILSLSSAPHRNNVAVRNAIRAFPGLFVGSAGNNARNADTHYPLIRTDRLNNQIVVGASDSSDRRSIWSSHSCGIGCLWGLTCNGPFVSGSNYGVQTVCLFAPGSSITTTRPGGGTTSVNGTSFSAPMVAGVAALMLSVNPDLTPRELRVLLIASVDPVSTLARYSFSGGRLHAWRAVRDASDLVSTITGDWHQPAWTSNSNIHGVVSASGQHQNEAPWRAFNGTMNGGSGGNGDNWSVRATNGWLQIRFFSYVMVHRIEFFNGVSGASNRTRNAHFTGRGGMALGHSFTAPNRDFGHVVIEVNDVITNVIQLNISSSYGNYVNAAKIVIHASTVSQPGTKTWIQPRWTSNTLAGHGTVSASGTYRNESPWRAFNGTMNGGSGGNGDNWSVNARTGWLELRLDYPIFIWTIEIWGNTSGGSNRTRSAYFTGAGGICLGPGFELANQNQAHKHIIVREWTNIIRLNIISSYGTFVGASRILIHAMV